jgi:hypothetical protein
MGEERNESEVGRIASVEARERRRSEVAAEVQRLAKDAEDLAERRAIMQGMDAVETGWPA